MTNRWVTRQTLIERVQDPDDQMAWDDFVAFYTGFIHLVLSQMNFQFGDRDDVTQEILLKIWKHLKSFDGETHKVRFRTWLGTLIRNMAITYINKNGTYEKRTDIASEILYDESKVISPPDLEEIIQYEWEGYVTRKALENMKELFTGVAIEAFELSLAGKQTNEISEILEITPASVRTLKNRVRIRLIEEIKHIRDSQEF